MEKLYLTWVDLRDRSISKNFPLQYKELQYRYDIFFVEDNVYYHTEIWKDTTKVEGIDVAQNDLDKTDFESNYKSEANAPVVPKTSDRLPKILSAVTSDNISLYVTGKTKTVTGSNDDVNNIVDSEFVDEIQLQGMLIAVKDAVEGDTVDVEVGYHDGTNWVIVKAFGKAVPMKDIVGWQEYRYVNNAVSKINPLLTIRTRLNQADINTTKKLLVHYITHK